MILLLSTKILLVPTKCVKIMYGALELFFFHFQYYNSNSNIEILYHSLFSYRPILLYFLFSISFLPYNYRLPKKNNGNSCLSFSLSKAIARKINCWKSDNSIWGAIQKNKPRTNVQKTKCSVKRLRATTLLLQS